MVTRTTCRAVGLGLVRVWQEIAHARSANSQSSGLGLKDANLTPGRESGQSRSLDIQVHLRPKAMTQQGDGIEESDGTELGFEEVHRPTVERFVRQ